MLKKLLIAIVFSIAFAYIESAVVVYLRVIFHPNGFEFPLDMFGITSVGKRLLLTEIGREAATLVLILTAAWLFGTTRQERIAYSLVIFAIWDIFYYVWLKLLLNWPGSIMDWDILFLIPRAWASPILYPVLISLLMFVFALVILHRNAQGKSLVVRKTDWIGWTAASLLVVVTFCLGGTHISEPDYAAHFHPLLFAVGYGLGVLVCVRAALRRSEEVRAALDSPPMSGADL
jgi:hypothetical protein